MKTDLLQRAWLTQWLSIAMISTLLLLPVTGFATPSDSKSPLIFGGHTPNPTPLIGTIFTVNSTGDGASVCPGAQCTLRGAILAANLQAGDDGISFAIPTTDVQVGRLVESSLSTRAQADPRNCSKKPSEFRVG